ncbi:heme-binding protein [Hymenobacter sp. ISL-91]|uniref:heme-binding protein n=1 Tax=Hymenobacter sp. ISL-91 TaxID=2819151 RepID=UPI001BE712A7|nr:heme-binding protein [Hymenobacter sp. ISL-91]MBT2557873.1 heme-binding protein [Hymenobacter sp. ISL-91]
MRKVRKLAGLSLAMLLPGLAVAQTTRPAAPSTSIAVAPAFRLTLATALELAARARAKAATLNHQVSVAVVDASGQTILLAQGDGVGPHNTEASRRKAFTALSTKTSTLVLGRKARANPDTQNLANLPELLLLGGGVPLRYQGQVIGAIGVSGGGGAENDDLIGHAASMPEAGITTP